MALGAMRLPLLLACALLGACGGPTVDANLEEAVYDPAREVDLAKSTRLNSGVYVRELTVGDGTEVMNQELISVRYSGWLSDGGLFDSNAADGGYFTFNYGAKQVIAGWEPPSLDGMKRGGVRQLVVPPSLAYGGSGAPPAVPPNTIVIFSVELLTETIGSPPGCGCSTDSGRSMLALMMLLFALKKGLARS